MRRTVVDPRQDWPKKLADLGMDLGTGRDREPASPYWREDAAYVLSEAEVEQLHDDTIEIERIVRLAVDRVVKEHWFDRLGIPPALVASAARSWAAGEPSLYGRYDLWFDGRSPARLFEYNADTPTALFEAAVVQWHWLQETRPGADQYNSIHEGLIETWTEWRKNRFHRVHFACGYDDDDDLLTTAYLLDTAAQSDMTVTLLPIEAIGWTGARFVDEEGAGISALFKLYPWDWLANEPFFPHLQATGPSVVEPAWRVLASSKGLLAVLWEMFPGHPNLLPAHFDRRRIDGPAVVKPLLGREGANVLVDDGKAKISTDGPYKEMATVAQAFQPLPSHDGWHPVIGAWVIGGSPRGIGIREDQSLVTGRSARFVPHWIEG